MSMTYNSLTAQVLNYLDRTDTSTTAQVPYFIYQAEQRICRECKTIGLEQYVVGTFIPGTSVYPKPARWRRSIAMNVGNGTNFNTRNSVEIRDYDYIRSYTSDPTTQLGLPKFYGDYGYSNILVGPTPDSAYPFEWAYIELPQPISATNQMNWLTNYAPDALLYATLLEAIPYLKNDERIPVWQQMYDRALASLNAQDADRTVDRGQSRGSD